MNIKRKLENLMFHWMKLERYIYIFIKNEFNYIVSLNYIFYKFKN